MSKNDNIKKAIINLLSPIDIIQTPIDFSAITKCHKNIAIVPFSSIQKKYDLDKKTIIEWLKTDDACSQYYPKLNRYIIYYNDLDLQLINQIVINFQSGMNWDIFSLDIITINNLILTLMAYLYLSMHKWNIRVTSLPVTYCTLLQA